VIGFWLHTIGSFLVLFEAVPSSIIGSIRNCIAHLSGGDDGSLSLAPRNIISLHFLFCASHHEDGDLIGSCPGFFFLSSGTTAVALVVFVGLV